ncbi:hypothetical protein [Acetanaerobacterium elongatum]|nr:hypothetical protein [Acetanaerobacterium elongatum]
MKRLSALILISVILLCSCQSNINTNTSSESATTAAESTVSVIEIESEPVAGSVPQSSAASEMVPEPLSYQEYFSKTRKFKSETQSKEYDKYAYYINSEAYIHHKDIRENYLCRQEIDSGKYEAVISDEVSSFCFYKNGTILCVVNKAQIIQYDMEGNKLGLVFEAKEPISNLISSSELIFYFANKTIYRLYIPTQTLDVIYHNDDIVAYKPISNIEIQFEKDNPEWINYYNETNDVEGAMNMPRTFIYYYNAMTGEQHIIPTAYGDFQQNP